MGLGSGPRDRHTAVPSVWGSSQWLQEGTQRTASSLQSPLLRGGRRAPSRPLRSPPRPRPQERGRRHALGVQSRLLGETLGRHGHPVQLSPHSGVRGSGGKAREWRGLGGRGEGGQDGQAARDLACGAQQGEDRTAESDADAQPGR